MTCDAGAPQPRRSLAVRSLTGVIGGYQRLISPLLAPRCRFYPSCSEYARQALLGHGALRGSWLASRRLVRCQPWGAGGVDLVPEPASSPSISPPVASLGVVPGRSTSRTGAPR